MKMTKTMARHTTIFPAAPLPLSWRGCLMAARIRSSVVEAADPTIGSFAASTKRTSTAKPPSRNFHR